MVALSDARKILDERLVRGEITPDEHEALLARIDNKELSDRTPAADKVPEHATQVEADDPNKLSKVLLGISLALGLLLGYTVRVRGMELNQLGSLLALVAAGCFIAGAGMWKKRQ